MDISDKTAKINICPRQKLLGTLYQDKENMVELGQVDILYLGKENKDHIRQWIKNMECKVQGI